MKNFYYSFCTLCLVIVFKNISHAQHQFDMSISGFYSTNEQTPFWSQANQTGVYPSKSPSILAIGSLNSDFKRDSLGRKSKLLDWGYGLTGGGIITEQGVKGVLPVAYLKAKIWEFEILAGRARQNVGLTGDTTLTSGSYALSGNALPVPGIQISIPEFRVLNFTEGWVALKAHYAENFIGDNRLRFNNLVDINNAMMHNKAVTLRIGNDDYPFKLYLGANHQVIWGGNLSQQISNEDMINSSLGTYKNVILGKSAHNLLIGDHTGSIDLGIEYQDYSWIYFFYRQNFYEGNNNNKSINWSDGLNGLEIRRHNHKPTTAIHINTALVEVLSTMSHKNYGTQRLGAYTRLDSYYNQSFYQSGWAYKGRTLGNPLLASKPMIREEHISNDDYLTSNNRVIALHTGVKGAFYKIPWMVKATYSRNHGTYSHEYMPVLNQFSFIMNTELPLKKFWDTQLQVGVSGDIGELYYNNFAFHLGIRKSGIL